MEINGNFVVLEGLDGAGTTTLLSSLGRYCRTEGMIHMLTCEPSEGFIGQGIRQVLNKRERLQPYSLAQLFAVDRREHLQRIGGFLQENPEGWVFCDRYLFSSLAYQSLSLPYEEVFALNRDFPLPWKTIYVRCSVETSTTRRNLRGQGELFGKKELFDEEEVQHRVLANYERAFQDLYPQGEGLTIIDGEKEREEVLGGTLQALGLA